MRFKQFLAAVVMLAGGMAMLSASASAWGRHHQRATAGDPYAYRFEPRGYYPYYKSYYWRPAHKVRRRRGIRAPRFYPAWGYYQRSWRHRKWHRKHHGGHRRWHW